MNNNSISIATMTWARDDKEEQLLRDALKELATLGLPVFITDGGSNTYFLDYIKGFVNFTLLEPPAKGVWPQVKTSLQAAHELGSQFIIYTESDKWDFFKQGLPDMINKFTIDDKKGIVLAVRSSAGFDSYPKFQQMTETTINNCCAEVTGVNTDYTYGPFIMNSTLVPYLNVLKPAIGWGWRPYAAVIANRLGYSIESFEGAYFCPVDQRGDDAGERVYRMKQLVQSIEGVVLGKTNALDR